MSKKQDKTLTMNRQGEFKIHTIGDSHCGTFTDQDLPVKYHMICVCETTTDERGFLFEQVGVDQFFQSIKWTKMSCERLTMSCAEKILTLIHKDNPKCKVRSIELTLSPFPYAASMTYSAKPAE
jgi:hypothetical protein